MNSGSRRRPSRSSCGNDLNWLVWRGVRCQEPKDRIDKKPVSSSRRIREEAHDVHLDLEGTSRTPHPQGCGELRAKPSKAGYATGRLRSAKGVPGGSLLCIWERRHLAGPGSLVVDVMLPLSHDRGIGTTTKDGEDAGASSPAPHCVSLVPDRSPHPSTGSGRMPALPGRRSQRYHVPPMALST
jgi:hypothetical protein